MRRFQCIRAVFVVLCLTVIAALAAAQGGAVRGSVEDTDGHAIKGATIKATNPNGRPSDLTATSDDKGRFALIGLSGGVWSFLAEAPGFMPQRGNSQIRSTSTGNSPIVFTLTRVEAPLPGALNKQIMSEIAAADELRNAGRFDQAIEKYQEIAGKNPKVTMVNVVIGDAYRQKAANETSSAARGPLYDRAIASYQQALKAEPDNDRARIELAMTLMQKGSLDDAERTLASTAESTTASREVVHSLAEIKFGKGDLAGAELLFQRAATMDPGWLLPKLKLGLVAYRKGNKEVAIEAFKKVIAAEPGSPEAVEAGTYLKELSK